MKAIILAAGKGTRMGDLSIVTPKPLLKVLGKTLLEHKLQSLPSYIDEVIIVVGHLKELIIETLGNQKEGKKITYVIQEELKGTGHSLSLCKDMLAGEEKFLVLMGDDIYSKKDIEMVAESSWAVLVSEVPSVKGKAEVILDEKGRIKSIQEKVPFERKGLICAGMYCIGPEIFEHPLVPISEKEFGLPQGIISLAHIFPVKPILATGWIQITEPSDLTRAEKLLGA